MVVTLICRGMRRNGASMKINKEELKRLSEKSDADMWAEILRIASSRGFELQKTPPKAEDLERIRRALSGAEKISLGEAAKIMNSYKNKK